MTTSTQARLRCYASDQIPHVWSRVSPLIARGLARGSNYTLPEIYQELRQKRMQLWAWEDSEIHAAMVTALKTSQSDVRYCLLLAIGGCRMGEWSLHLPVVEEWAKEKGCTEMRIYGRKGWARQLGFTPIYTKLVREI